MSRRWQTKGGRAVLGLIVGLSMVGCTARPAPRPESQAISPNQNLAVEKTVETVTGSGDAEAVVMGNVALVAIQVGATQPGGTDGRGLIGTTTAPRQQGTSGGTGPGSLQGTGGSVGASPAMPGGGINPGGATPGGSPNSTQAITNGNGDLATQSPTGSTPIVVPGSVGSAPMDVMIRIAENIKAKHPTIKDVRFATQPRDALRLAIIAREIQNGKSPTAYIDELNQLKARAVPAGTTIAPPPSQGQQPTIP